MKEILNEILKSSRMPEGIAWRRLDFKSEQLIIQKGDIGRTLFYIEKGMVRVLGDATLEENRRISHSICDMRDGDIFGDVCLYGENQRTATIKALTDVQVLEVRTDSLSVYLDDHPILGYIFLKKLFEIMTNRLSLANDRIENLLAWGIKAHAIDKYL